MSFANQVQGQYGIFQELHTNILRDNSGNGNPGDVLTVNGDYNIEWKVIDTGLTESMVPSSV